MIDALLILLTVAWWPIVWAGGFLTAVVLLAVLFYVFDPRR